MVVSQPARRAHSVFIDDEEVFLLFALIAINEPLSVRREIGLRGMLEPLRNRDGLARYRSPIRAMALNLGLTQKGKNPDK